jgi:TonB family protein
VDAAFTIFKGGNIDKPIIRKSAGDENLNSLALRAIYDSAPFPPLPKEWKQPYLTVGINFKYVPEDN